MTKDGEKPIASSSKHMAVPGGKLILNRDERGWYVLDKVSEMRSTNVDISRS